MKPLSSALAAGAGLLLAVTSSNAQELITFDDLTLSTYGGPIPNGYAGFEWDSFGALDPQSYPSDPVGYLSGMVSPRQVAFPAYVGSLDGPTTGGFHSSGSVFDLNSAYLTSAWNDGLQVEVLGFVRGQLTYSSAFTLDTTGPTLVNFNYLGIDRVTFSSQGGIPHGNPGGGGSHMVIDNLVVTIPEPSTVSLLLLGAGLMGYGMVKRGLRHKQLP